MLLAIDTATRMMSLALHDGRQITFERTWVTANNHTIELTPAIRRALQVNQLAPNDLSAIAVAQGPGSFTGLRIGMGVAKGLAAAQDMKLVAIPTLWITASAVPLATSDLIAVLQAGRGRICAQRFIPGADVWEPASDPEILPWQNLIARIERPTQLSGEIDETGAEHLRNAALPHLTIAPATVRLRRAGYLAELAWDRLRAGREDDPVKVTPIYLHQPGVPHP